MPDYTTLRGVEAANQPLTSENLETSLISFFQWGFLGIGGFINVSKGQAGVYGGDYSRLRLSDDKRYTKGKVWEGFRKDWVWESGIEYSVQPIIISGVYVNNLLVTSGYNIDYLHGRVLFDNAISSTSIVQCEYSYRYYQFVPADIPWFRKLKQGDFRVDDAHFLLYGSGTWSIPPEQRMQLPALVFEVIPSVNIKSKEIGSLAQWHNQEVRIHVIAETDNDFWFLHDVVIRQCEKRIRGIDKYLMMQNTGFPLNFDGTLSNNPKTYPDLVKPSTDGGYYWNIVAFRDFRSWINDSKDSITNTSLPFYWCTIRGIFEVDVP